MPDEQFRAVLDLDDTAYASVVRKTEQTNKDLARSMDLIDEATKRVSRSSPATTKAIQDNNQALQTHDLSTKQVNRGLHSLEIGMAAVTSGAGGLAQAVEVGSQRLALSAATFGAGGPATIALVAFAGGLQLVTTNWDNLTKKFGFAWSDKQAEVMERIRDAAQETAKAYEEASKAKEETDKKTVEDLGKKTPGHEEAETQAKETFEQIFGGPDLNKPGGIFHNVLSGVMNQPGSKGLTNDEQHVLRGLQTQREELSGPAPSFQAPWAPFTQGSRASQAQDLDAKIQTLTMEAATREARRLIADAGAGGAAGQAAIKSLIKLIQANPQAFPSNIVGRLQGLLHTGPRVSRQAMERFQAEAEADEFEDVFKVPEGGPPAMKNLRGFYHQPPQIGPGHANPLEGTTPAAFRERERGNQAANPHPGTPPELAQAIGATIEAMRAGTETMEAGRARLRDLGNAAAQLRREFKKITGRMYTDATNANDATAQNHSPP
jgi:hypothetical protein